MAETIDRFWSWSRKKTTFFHKNLSLKPVKHLCERLTTRTTNLGSTIEALNLFLFGENEPRTAKNAQKWKMGSCGNAKCSVSVQATQMKMHPPNVPKAGLQKCGPDPGR